MSDGLTDSRREEAVQVALDAAGDALSSALAEARGFGAAAVAAAVNEYLRGSGFHLRRDPPTFADDAPRLLSGFDLLEALARGTGGEVLHVTVSSCDSSCGPEGPPCAEIRRAAPWLFDEEGACRFAQVLQGGGAHLVCSHAFAEWVRETTVGDDGPTERNAYAGPARVNVSSSAGWDLT